MRWGMVGESHAMSRGAREHMGRGASAVEAAGGCMGDGQGIHSSMMHRARRDWAVDLRKWRVVRRISRLTLTAQTDSIEQSDAAESDGVDAGDSAGVRCAGSARPVRMVQACPRNDAARPRKDAPCPQNGGSARTEAIPSLRGQVRSIPGFWRGAQPDVLRDGRRKGAGIKKQPHRGAAARGSDGRGDRRSDGPAVRPADGPAGRWPDERI